MRVSRLCWGFLAAIFALQEWLASCDGAWTLKVQTVSLEAEGQLRRVAWELELDHGGDARFDAQEVPVQLVGLEQLGRQSSPETACQQSERGRAQQMSKSCCCCRSPSSLGPASEPMSPMSLSSVKFPKRFFRRVVPPRSVSALTCWGRAWLPGPQGPLVSEPCGRKASGCRP